MTQLTSVGQIKSETARFFYKSARKIVNNLVASGKILPEHESIAYARLLVSDLIKYKLHIPKKYLAEASTSVSLPIVDNLIAKQSTAELSKVGVITSTAKSAPISTATATTRQLATETAKSTAKGAFLVAAGVFVAESIYTGYKLWRGKITRKEAFRRTACSAASNAGGATGAVIGAAVGSCVPIIGTAVGGFLGGTVGGITSRYLIERKMV